MEVVTGYGGVGDGWDNLGGPGGGSGAGGELIRSEGLGGGGMFCLHMRGLPFRVTEQVRHSTRVMTGAAVDVLFIFRRSLSGSAQPRTRWMWWFITTMTAGPVERLTWGSHLTETPGERCLKTNRTCSIATLNSSIAESRLLCIITLNIYQIFLCIISFRIQQQTFYSFRNETRSWIL